MMRERSLATLKIAIKRALTLAIQRAPPGLRAEETCVVRAGVPSLGVPHMTGKPLVHF